jgi:hypothetical protein
MALASRMGGLATGIVLLLVGATHGSAEELETFVYGRWTGTAHSDAAGGFDRCTVLANFKRASASTMRDVGAAISIDRANGWRIGFIEPGVAVSGRTGTYKMMIDGERLIEAVPDAVVDQMAALALSDPVPVFGRMRRGNVLSVDAVDEQYDLPLAGVGRALDWLEGCVTRYTAFVARGREKAAAESAEMRREIAATLSDILPLVEARDIRVGPPVGTPAFPSEDKFVTWRADAVEGAAQIWAGRSAKALAEEIVATNVNCARRNLPNPAAPARAEAKPSKKPKPDKVAFAVVDCDDTLGTRRVALVLWPRRKGGLYQVTVTARANETPDKVEAFATRLADAARAKVN